MGKKRFGKKLAAVILAVTVAAAGTPGQVSGAGEEVGTLRETADEAKEAALLQQIEEQYEDVDLSEAAEERFGTAALIVGCSHGEDWTLKEPEGGRQKADKVIALGNGLFALFYPDTECAQAAWKAYQDMEGILFAEPDAVVESKEWTGGLRISEDTEESEVSQVSEKIREPEDMQMTERLSEDRSDMKSAVIAAVIDTGVDLQNAAIAEYLVNKESRIGGEAATADIMDENGHGTRVTGLLTDVFRQSGLSRTQVGILPVKVADADGRCTVLQLYLGIKSAMEQGADILNISLGTNKLGESELLRQVMEEAYRAGVTVVTSAGNDSADAAGYAPANISSVITVGSVDRRKVQSEFSNYGRTLDCVSYGEEIAVTGPGGEKAKEDGTSYAAAFVTAELAVRMAAGGINTPDEVDSFIQSAAEDLGAAGWDEVYGYGLVGGYGYPGEPKEEPEEGTEEEQESEAEEHKEPEVPEAEECEPAPDREYIQKVNTYNLLIGDIGLLASGENIESTRLLADTMKRSVEEYFQNKTDIREALKGEVSTGVISGKRYACTGNEEIDKRAEELEGYLKESVFSSDNPQKCCSEFLEYLDKFVDFLAGCQKSIPLERNVYVEASTEKTVSDAAALQSIAQTAGDHTVKLSADITTTSEIIVTNGCTLRLQSNAKNVRRTIRFGNLPASAKNFAGGGMCMFRVDGWKANRLYIGTADGDYPVTLGGAGKPHNGFLIYNSPWALDTDSYKSVTRIYPGTRLENNVMYYDNSNCFNGASGSAICNYGTLYIYGGIIQNNGFQGKSGEKVGEGAGVANYNKFYMSGGEIRRNVAANGNGILAGKMGDVMHLAGFEMKITGGSIHENGNAADRKYTSNGGAILINPNTPVSIGGSSIDGVKIYGNAADYGGGIANYGICNLGKCRIYENYSGSEGGGILNRARVNTAVMPVLNIDGTYVYHNYCSRDNSVFAGGIASLKRTVGEMDIVPQITVKSGYFYDNDGFSIHIDSGTLSFGAGTRFGFSTYNNASSYSVTEEWRGSGVCNTGGIVNITGTARMFVPSGATGIKNTGMLNIGDGANFGIFCKNAECGINNTGRLTCGKSVKNGNGDILYPYTIDGSADYGIRNTGTGTAYLTGRIRGNYSVANTAKREDVSQDNQNIGIGIYNTSAASYSAANPYAVILQGTEIDGRTYAGYVGYAGNGILNYATAGSISLKQGEVAYCSGNGIVNKGKAYIQGADAGIYENGRDGIYNHKDAELTISSACAVFQNKNRGIGNAGTALISANAEIYGNNRNGITNDEEAELTISGAAEVYGNGGSGIHNYKTMTVSGAAKIYGNTGYGLENSGTTVLNGNLDVHSNGKAGIINGGGHKLTMSRGNVRENALRGIVNRGIFELKGGSITGNRGTAGAGIYNNEDAALNISGGIISGNTGTGSGAGLYNCGAVTITGGSIAGNSSGTNGGGIFNEISGNISLNGGFLYGNNEYGIWNLGICNINGIKVGFSSFTSNASYVTSQNAGGGIYNAGVLHLANGGYINGGNAPAVVNAGTLNADAGAATVLMSLSGDVVLNNTGKIDTAYAAGKTSMWVLGGKCRYGIANTGSMKFSGKADGRYRVTAAGYTYQDENRGFTEAAIYNNSGELFDSSYPYACYLYGAAYAMGSVKDAVRTDEGSSRIDEVYIGSSKNGVNVGNKAALQLSDTNARIYSNEVGIYNNGAVSMNSASIYGNTKHGIYQNGIFNMSGAARVNVSNDVCLPADHVITVKGALTTKGAAARVTPLQKKGMAFEKITDKENEEKRGIGRVIVKTGYAGGKASDALFFDTAGYRFILSNGGILRPGDYMDQEALSEVQHTEISDGDIVISNKYVVTYEKNIHETDGSGNQVDVAVADMPVSQDKFWCENLQLPDNADTYTKPSVSTEPYASYYRFSNWNDRADGTGNTVLLPMVYKENQDAVIYALWQKNFNVAYIGNGQSTGEDFTEYDISQDSMYVFDDNMELNGTKHFTKEIENSYIDDETGEEVKQKTTATVVQWGLEKEAPIGEQNYDMESEVSTSSLYARAKEMSKQKDNVLTIGTPNADYGLFGVALAGQPFINLYAIWDEGPIIEAYDLYYTLEEAQKTTNTKGITMEELLSRAAAIDKEDGILPFGRNEDFGNGKKTTFIVSDYAVSKFSAFTEEGSATINYQAVDSVGNITNKMVTVHIVDTAAKKTDKKKVRFINEKYLNTLSEGSVWKTDSKYYGELLTVLENRRENVEVYTRQAFGKAVTLEKAGTGTWKTEPEQIWIFSQEQVDAVKEYINSNGRGNLKRAGALKGFLAQFGGCRK